MSSLDKYASSDVEVDVGAEGSNEDYCEELQQAEEEITLDVCQSSRRYPPPKTGAPATGLPAADPPCRSNEPSCRLAGQRSMSAWLPSAGAHKPRSSTNETTKKRRDNKRQKDVEQAAASSTTPARAAHIEKPRAIRRNKDRRKTKEGEGGGLEEEDNEENEEEYEEDGVGTKRKLKGKGWRQNKAVIHPRGQCSGQGGRVPWTDVYRGARRTHLPVLPKAFDQRQKNNLGKPLQGNTSCADSGGVQEEGDEQAGV